MSEPNRILSLTRVFDAPRELVWDRLAMIKRRYDPTNLFRLNQNIPPAQNA